MFIYIILAVIQGLTEFLPVSSSGHEALVFFFSDSAEFSRSFIVSLHIATLASVLVWYRMIIFEFIRDVLHFKRLGLALKLLVASIPSFAAGLAISRLGLVFNEWFTCAALILVGFLFIWFDRDYKPPTVNTKTTLSSVDSISRIQIFRIGLAQACAIIPGVSRSGATILAASAQGIDRIRAIDVSFLMSIPVIAGAGVYEVFLSSDEVQGTISGVTILISAAVAFSTGLIAIKMSRGWVVKYGLKPFGYYRILVGFAVLLLLLT